MDPLHRTRGEAGLHGGADRGDGHVHVDGGEVGAADDGDGGAEPGELLAERGPGVVGDVAQQVLHLVLVGRVVPARSCRRAVVAGRPGVEDGGCCADDPFAADHALEHAQQQHPAEPARVDDPGVPEDGQAVGRALQRPLRLLARRRDDGRERGLGLDRPLGRLPGTRRGGCGNGEQRALHGPGDGRPGQVRAGLQRAGELARRQTGLFRRQHGEGVRDRAEQLRQQHPGVAARAEQGALGEGASHRRRVGAGAPDGLVGRGPRVQQVGAGVGVGHREDVEPVELLACALQHQPTRCAPGPHGAGVEDLQHGTP